MKLALAALSSLLLVLSFPRFSLSALMSVALTPLLVAAAREQRHGRRFVLGWLTGAGCLAGVTDWIRFVVTFHGGLGEVGGWGVFFLYCLAKGLYFGVFGLLAGPLMSLWWAVPAISALWVAVDFTLGSLGYVWITAGHAGADMGIPMRLAPYTGVHGLSFAFMIMATAMAQVALRSPRRRLLWLLALPLLILLPPLPEFAPGQTRAAIVQPNVEEERTWPQGQVEELHRMLALMSMQTVLKAGAKKPELIIWPEVPAPFYYDEDLSFRQNLGSLARATRTHVLFGTVV
ncbi:MAG: apolipoprotein N-acyltransferase, partial [Bryobacteraceae bacterium]